MATLKPKGWNGLSKAQQDAWKKANFNKSVKVTEAQLDKLRKEGTPAKAIAKYKNDPTMREALNRFYGKKRVGEVTADPKRSSLPPGSGPGKTRQNPKSGGPGAKTGFDGRAGLSKNITMGSRTGGRITVNRAANEKRKAEFQKRTATAVAVGATVVPVGRGAMMVGKAASKVAPKALPKAKAMASKVKSMGTKTPKVAETPKAAQSLPKVTPKLKPRVAPKTAPKTAVKKTSTPKSTPKKGSQ